MKHQRIHAAVGSRNGSLDIDGLGRERLEGGDGGLDGAVSWIPDDQILLASRQDRHRLRKAACEKAEVPLVSPHKLRHTFISLMDNEVEAP